jgi:hypothetical protein
MSYAMTTEAVLRHEKDVTRRLGWTRLKPGGLFVPVERAMGLKKGEKHVALWPLCRCVSNTPEVLRRLIDEPEYGRVEMVREGFPGMDPAEFVARFIRMNHLDRNTYSPDTQVVNRIELEYVHGDLRP